MAEIARRARASVGAFYARFPDKDALVGYLNEPPVRGRRESWDAFLAPERWRKRAAARDRRGGGAARRAQRRANRGLLRALALYAARVRRRGSSSTHGHQPPRPPQARASCCSSAAARSPTRTPSGRSRFGLLLVDSAPRATRSCSASGAAAGKAERRRAGARAHARPGSRIWACAAREAEMTLLAVPLLAVLQGGPAVEKKNPTVRGDDPDARRAGACPGWTRSCAEPTSSTRQGDGEPLQMDVYSPPGPPRPRPAVMLVHGGPIPKIGAKNMGVFVSYGELLAASGFVAVSFDHRFLGAARLPDAGADVADLMSHVRQTRTRWASTRSESRSGRSRAGDRSCRPGCASGRAGCGPSWPTTRSWTSSSRHPAPTAA